MEMSSTPVVAAAAGKIFKAPVRAGRGVPEITEAYIKKCSCRREKTIVFCRACGYYCHGRIRLKCEQHPRVSEINFIEGGYRCCSPEKIILRSRYY